MNKSELLASMAEKGKITKVDAERALNAFIQSTSFQSWKIIKRNCKQIIFDY